MSLNKQVNILLEMVASDSGLLSTCTVHWGSPVGWTPRVITMHCERDGLPPLYIKHVAYKKCSLSSHT